MAEEEIQEKIAVDYEAIDEATGFKKVEFQIWKAYEEFLAKPEDDRGDVDGWVDEFAEEKKLDKRRVKYVTTMGIYAGPRDEFNQRTESGKAIYATSDVYEGAFFEGKKEGQGHYVFKKHGQSEVDKLLEKLWKSKPETTTKEQFIDEAARSLKIGRAIVEAALEYGFYPCYHGEYQRGLRTGEGLMKCKDGSVYKGSWKDNLRHGQGIYYYITGDVYSGQWDSGFKHGFGTYRFASGGEYRGEWVKGVFIEGQWIMNDANYFEGLFDKKNKPNDVAGIIHFPTRKIEMRGVFKKGKWAPLSNFAASEEHPVAEAWES